MIQRKTTTIKERLTPCCVCGHPLSQRHHLLHFSDYGENDKTVQLCANCHEIYHIFYQAYIGDKGKRSMFVAGSIISKLGTSNSQIMEIYKLVLKSREIEKNVSIEIFSMIDAEGK